MSNLPSLRERYLTNTGLVLNAGKLHTYQAGTTTDKATYTTSARDVANSNPITLDAYGMPPNAIHLLPGEAYKFVLKDSAGNTIWTEDNVFGATIDDADLSAHLYEMADNPNRYGAVGTGASDESSSIADAIAAIVASGRAGGVVDLLGRTYRCDSQLVIPSGITLRNGTLDFSNSTANAHILIQGTRGASVALTANAGANAESVTVGSTTGFAAGDMVYVYDSSGNINGELKRVSTTLSAPARIVLATALEDAYTTANSAAVEEITPKTNVRLEDLVIISNPAQASGDGDVVLFNMAKDCYVRGVRIQGHRGSGIETRQSMSIKITDCTVEQVTPVATSASAGINICDASREISVTGCTVTRSYFGVIVGQNTSGGAGGVSRDVMFSGCSFSSYAGSSIGMVWLDSMSQYVTVDNCHFEGSDTDLGGAGATYATAIGVRVEAWSATVSDCTFHGLTSGGSAVYLDSTDNRSTATGSRIAIVTGNRVRANANVVSGDLTYGYDRITITGNTDSASSNTDHGGVSLNKASGAAASSKNIVVANNNFGGTGRNGGIEVTVTSTTYSLQHISISGNICSSIYVNGNSTIPTEDVSITGNVLNFAPSSADGCIQCQHFGRIVVSGNKIYATPVDYAIYLNAGSGSSSLANATGNLITMGSVAATSAAIRIDDAYHSTANGNVISCPSTSNGIYIYANTQTVGMVSVSCNNLEGVADNTLYSAIRIEGDNVANPVARFAVAGNSIISGGRGVRIEGYVNGGAITGNVIDIVSDSYSNIYLNGAAAGTVKNIAVSGNSIVDGAYGVEASNTASIIHDGNVFSSQATSHQTGLAAGTSGAGGNYIT